MVLAARDRLQTQVAAQTAAPDSGRIRQELRALLAAMRVTRPEIDAGAGAIKATKLAALIGFIEHRLELIVTPPREHAALPDEVAALVMPEAAPAAIARSALAVGPAAEQPELPIPSPIGALPPMTLVAKAPAPATHAFGQDPAQKPRDPEAAVVGPAPPWQPLQRPRNMAWPSAIATGSAIAGASTLDAGPAPRASEAPNASGPWPVTAPGGGAMRMKTGPGAWKAGAAAGLPSAGLSGSAANAAFFFV